MKRGPDDRASINLPNAAWAVSRQMEHEPVADGGTRRSIGKLVDGVLEALAGRELRHVACRDVNFRTRRRVAALAGFAARYGEIAEADEADVAAVLQFALNGLKTASTAEDASAFESPALSATAATSSFLFMFPPLSCWFETTVFLRRGCESNAHVLPFPIAPNPLECKGCSMLLQQKRPAERRSSLFFWPKGASGTHLPPYLHCLSGQSKCPLRPANQRTAGRPAGLPDPIRWAPEAAATRARSPRPSAKRG